MAVVLSVIGKYDGKDLAKAQKQLAALQAQSDTFAGKFQRLGGQLQSFGNSMAKTGKSLTAGVTLPIVGVGIAATKMAMDFDTSLTKMVSLVGLTRDEVDGMRGDIITHGFPVRQERKRSRRRAVLHYLRRLAGQ
jgi:hypothetical protein